MFVYTTKIRLQHTDAAGRIFYARLFDILHEAFEEWLVAQGVAYAELFSSAVYALPIVHAEADFRLPLSLHQQICVELAPQKRGGSSFAVQYHVRLADQQLAAEALTVHVAVDKATQRPIPLPKDIMKKVTDTFFL